MCKRDIASMRGPASMEADRFVPTHKVEATVRPSSSTIPEDPFDMRVLEEATAWVEGEPFPSIAWVSEEASSWSQERNVESHPSKAEQKRHYFLMSPQARRLKRRRRGRGNGYLVRCLEAQSLLLFFDDAADDGLDRKPPKNVISDHKFTEPKFQSILSGDCSQSSRSDTSNASSDAMT